VLAAAMVAMALAGGGPRADGLPDGLPGGGEVFFESRVRPLLVERCQSCHGPRVSEAGLRLDSRGRLLVGSDAGPVIVPGDPAASRLIAAVTHSAAGVSGMPPGDRLSADEVAVLETWVAAGVPWSGPGSDEVPEHPEDDVAGRAARHWSFRRPERHPLPALPSEWPAELATAWSGSPIDRFVATAAAAAGVLPSPDAPPRELVRRLWFDLTGLPPPADEVEAWCDEPTEERYTALVERLLASPEHAEHWARFWLDLARYADTMGYALDGQDNRYPHAWTYRDWVVRALASDMPYDRFVTLQLAADLQQPPVPAADLAALGFLTVGRTFIGNRHDIIDDQIDLVTRGLMGLSVACARCHDHKYEPISAADYYGLHGIFLSCTVPKELPVIGPGAAGAEAEAFAATRRKLEEAIVAHDAEVHARAIREAVAHAADYFLETARPIPRKPDGRPPVLDDGYEIEQLVVDRLTRLLGGADAAHPVLGGWMTARSLADFEVAEAIAGWLQSSTVEGVVRQELRSARPTTLRQLAEAYGRLAMRVAPEVAGGPGEAAAADPDLAVLRAVLGVEGSPLVVIAADVPRVSRRSERLQRRKLEQQVTQHDAVAVGGPPRAMVVCDDELPTDSPVMHRGDPGRLGDVIPRRMPTLLGGTPAAADASGRAELARCITSPDNPLTARHVVNWVWQHHFGRGLVATADDLGLRGEPPSHPELLDDLARRFIEEGGWSLRWLHREIVTSRTWRQSSAARPDLLAHDPDGRLLARSRRKRLEWEAWRDALLMAAGTLDPGRRGGPGIDPLALDAMHVRSLYAWIDRQNVPGTLRAFDVASPDTAVLQRARTLSPQRALVALNSPLSIEAARRIAERVDRECGVEAAPAEIVTALWRAVLSRNPDPEERTVAEAWLVGEEAAEPAHSASQPLLGPRVRLAHALLATAEFEWID
jgi:mono/diheme cytochrome c family protein